MRKHEPDPTPIDPQADSPQGETPFVLHYTQGEIIRLVHMMAEGPLKGTGSYWKSMADFMERSRAKACDPDLSDNPEWALVFDAFATAIRQLVLEHDKDMDEEKQDLANCHAGTCQHERRSQTVSVTFTGCV